MISAQTIGTAMSTDTEKRNGTEKTGDGRVSIGITIAATVRSLSASLLDEDSGSTSPSHRAGNAQEKARGFVRPSSLKGVPLGPKDTQDSRRFAGMQRSHAKVAPPVQPDKRRKKIVQLFGNLVEIYGRRHPTTRDQEKHHKP